MSRVRFLDEPAQYEYGEGEVDMGDFIEEGIEGVYEDIDEYHANRAGAGGAGSGGAGTKSTNKQRITFQKEPQVFYGDENQNEYDDYGEGDVGDEEYEEEPIYEVPEGYHDDYEEREQDGMYSDEEMDVPEALISQKYNDMVIEDKVMVNMEGTREGRKKGKGERGFFLHCTLVNTLQIQD